MGGAGVGGVGCGGVGVGGGVVSGGHGVGGGVVVVGGGGGVGGGGINGGGGSVGGGGIGIGGGGVGGGGIGGGDGAWVAVALAAKAYGTSYEIDGRPCFCTRRTAEGAERASPAAWARREARASTLAAVAALGGRSVAVAVGWVGRP